MKSFSLFALLCAGALFTVSADDTTVQVAPSDQVRYPDASELLNRTEAKAPVGKSTAVIPNRPLVASTPILAKAPTAQPLPSTPSTPTDRGWYLKWSLGGDEDSALAWTQGLGLPAALHAGSPGVWEVWAGPLDTAAVRAALKAQPGSVTLVRK